MAPQIYLENRFKEEIGNFAKMTIDGMDMRILEPWPFSTKWHSHK
jgi:hypothetical protein